MYHKDDKAHYYYFSILYGVPDLSQSYILLLLSYVFRVVDLSIQTSSVFHCPDLSVLVCHVVVTAKG